MTDRLNEFKSVEFFAVMLHDETPEHTKLILSGNNFSGKGFTHGLYYRGIY